MIIAVIVSELILCLVSAAFLAVGAGGETFHAPVFLWLALAFLQVTIHYLPRSRITRYSLSLLLLLLLAFGVLPGKFETITFSHQPFFIAAIGVLPQFWLEWFSERRSLLVRLAVALAALPLGLSLWVIVNIWIVKIEAWVAASGNPYCLLVSNGKIFPSGYVHPASDWSLSGWRLISPYGGGGNGDCCQWNFHALVLTHDNRLFNWSYKSQTFERVSDKTKSSMSLYRLNCN